MNYSAIFSILTYLLVAGAAFLFPADLWAATTVNISGNSDNSSTSVNVSSNTGNNTIRQNGECTTTSSGKGKSTVCINGKCTTSEDGEIHLQSDGGNTKVDISNRSGDGSKAAEPDKAAMDDDIDIDKESPRSQGEKKGETKEQHVFARILAQIKSFFENFRFF